MNNIPPDTDIQHDQGHIPPAFKVGPVKTQEGEALWGYVFLQSAKGSSCPFYSIKLRTRIYSNQEGKWQDCETISMTQFAALAHVLKKCEEFVFSRGTENTSTDRN